MTTHVFVNVDDNANAACIVPSSDLSNVSTFKIDKGVRIVDRSVAISDQHRPFFHCHELSANLTKLELSFLSSNSMSNKTSFVVIENPEVFSYLSNLDNIHDTRRIFWVSPDLVIHFD